MQKKITMPIAERRLTISDPDQLRQGMHMFLNKDLVKEWYEEFVDKDTGEVVRLPRNEILYKKGLFVDNDYMPQIAFNFQAGEFDEIEFTNVPRQCVETKNGKNTYLVTTEIAENGTKKKKVKFMFTAVDIPSAIEIINEFIALNFTGMFRIVNIREYDTALLIDNYIDEPENEDEKPALTEFRHLTAYIYYDDIDYSTEDEYPDNIDAVINSTDIADASAILKEFINVKLENRQVDHLTPTEAKIIAVDRIIPREFVEAYNELNAL